MILYFLYKIIEIRFIMQEQLNQSKRRVISSSQKRDLMWNILEPGDPYDIRKSMIAKLPGDRKFMGPHLEIICLLQAAEIERLCLFLQEFQVKQRQAERVELDRHSYEVQIKELTQKLAESSSYRNQNDKLKEYIRRQTIEVQELQKKAGMEINRKYESSLRQIEIILKEKEDLQEANRRLAAEARSIKELSKVNQQLKVKEIQALSREYERLQDQHANYEKKQKEGNSKWEQERKRIESQSLQARKRYQEEIQDLENTNKGLRSDLERLKIDAARGAQLTVAIKQYETRFKLLGEEIERLNGVLRQKSKQLNEEYQRSKQLSESSREKQQKLNELQQRTRKLQEANSSLQKQQRENLAALSTLQQNKAVIQSYEASLQKFSIEVNRLNSILRKKLSESEDTKKKLESTEKEYLDYKIRSADTQRRVELLQRENEELQQENESNNYKLRRLNEDLNACQAKLAAANKGKQMKAADRMTVNQIEEEIKPAKIRERKTGGDLQSFKHAFSKSQEEKRRIEQKLSSMEEENEFLRAQLKEKAEQAQFYKKRSLPSKTKDTFTASDSEDWSSKVKKLKGDLQQAQKQISKLRKEPSPSQSYQAAQKQALMKQCAEIARLQDQLISKDIVISRLTEINESLREKMDEERSQRDEEDEDREKPWKIRRDRIKIDKLQQDNEELKRSNDQLRSRLEQIKGFETSVRTEVESRYVQPSQVSYKPTPSKQYESDPKYNEPSHKLSPTALKKRYNKDQEERINLPDEDMPRARPSITRHRRENPILIEQHQQKPYQFEPSFDKYSTQPWKQDPSIQSQIRYQRPSEDYQSQRIRQEQTSYVSPKRDNQQVATYHPTTEVYATQQVKQRQSNVAEKQASPPKSSQVKQDLSQSTLKQNYNKLLKEYQSLSDQNQKSKLQLYNLQEQRQKLAEDSQKQAQLLQFQILKLKERIDPQSYQQVKEEVNLKNQYSNLLQRQSQLISQNEQLHRQISSMQGKPSLIVADSSQEGEIRQLLAENQEMRRQCKQIPQYHAQLVAVNTELERLGGLLIDREQELAKKDTHIQQYQTQRVGFITKLKDRDGKIQLLSQDLIQGLPEDVSKKLTEHLQRSGEDYDRIIQEYQQNQSQARAEKETLKQRLQAKIETQQHEIARINGLLAHRKKDIEVQEEQLKSLRRELEESRKGKDSLANSKLAANYQEKIVLLSQEVQRLNNILKTRIQVQKDMQAELTRCKLQLNAGQVVQEKLREQAAGLRASAVSRGQVKVPKVEGLNEYTMKLLELSSEVERLNGLLMVGRERTETLERKEAKFVAEIQRLNNSLRLKVEESIHNQGREQSFDQQKSLLARQLSEQRQKCERLIIRQQQLSQQNSRFQQHLNQYEKRVSKFYDEFQRLQKIITKMKEDNETRQHTPIDDLIAKNRYLGEQIDRLQLQSSAREKQLSQLRLQLADLSTLQNRTTEHLSLFVILFAEIQSLRSTLQQSQGKLLALRRAQVSSRRI